MSSEKIKIENPGLFIIMLILFCLSFSFIGYGVMKLRSSSQPQELKTASEVGIKNEESEELLSKYFESQNDSGSTSGKDDYYLQTDPFRKTCSASGGAGKTPFVVSGIVCYR